MIRVVLTGLGAWGVASVLFACGWCAHAMFERRDDGQAPWQ